MASPDPIHDTSKLPSSTASSSYQYPFAPAPDIIRAHQKDQYFADILQHQLLDILRKLRGARFVHAYMPETRVFSELLYLCCTTLIGNRTLGEEYCDVLQVESETMALPMGWRRAGYILSSVLGPWLVGKIVPRVRNRVRAKLEGSGRGMEKQGWGKTVRLYVLDNLAELTSPSPIYAISLALFYFTGAYYHLGKRIFGLRYMFTKRLSEADQQGGYEVLGVLLALQMVVQSYLHVSETLRHGVAANDSQDMIEDSVKAAQKMSSIEKNTNTPILSKPRYDLGDDTTFGWIEGRQQRKCTLCLEPLKDPSATTCGHVFCWTCITDWIKEKAECPLCRQGVMGQHVLPLRSS